MGFQSNGHSPKRKFFCVEGIHKERSSKVSISPAPVYTVIVRFLEALTIRLGGAIITGNYKNPDPAGVHIFIIIAISCDGEAKGIGLRFARLEWHSVHKE